VSFVRCRSSAAGCFDLLFFNSQSSSQVHHSSSVFPAEAMAVFQVQLPYLLPQKAMAGRFISMGLLFMLLLVLFGMFIASSCRFAVFRVPLPLCLLSGRSPARVFELESFVVQHGGNCQPQPFLHLQIAHASAQSCD
jgi:hypothetical protein